MQSQWPTTDELLKLAQENPEELESFRQREIEYLITSAPQKMQRRLRGLQFQIDTKRSLSKNPMAACLAISQMMFDSVHELNDILNGEGKKINDRKVSEVAEVLSFPAVLSL